MAMDSEAISAADMDPNEAREAAQEALDRMNLSKEETDRLGKAFKDPQFMRMFQEYVDEIKDPAHREETEQYLREVEARGQAAELYGQGVQLITPCSGFVVKSKIVAVDDNATTNKVKEPQDESSSLELGMKVFVNVCHSDKVSKATSTQVNGGCNWSIPYSLGAVRRGKDKAGAACDEHDFVVSTDTFDQCRTDVRFKGLVIDTALEAVESSTGRGVKVSREFSFPKMKYKGDTKQPSVQAWRDKSKAAPGSTGSSLIDGRIRPAARDQAVPNPAVDRDGDARNKSASKFNFDFAAANAKTSFTRQSELERVIDGGACHEPVYDIVYRYTRNDLGDAWQQGDANKQLDDAEERKRPDVLVMKIDLPRLESIAKVALDVTRSSVSLTCESVYTLNVPFPLPVDEARGKAQFDKQKRQLTITLPVAPDLRKKLVKPFVEPHTAGDDASCDDTPSNAAPLMPHAKKLVEEVPRPDGEDAPANVAASMDQSPSLRDDALDGCGPDYEKTTTTQVKQESDIERRWREMHERTDAERIGSQATQIGKTDDENEREENAAPDDNDCSVPLSFSSSRPSADESNGSSMDGNAPTLGKPSETVDIVACSVEAPVQEEDDTMKSSRTDTASQPASIPLPAVNAQKPAPPKLRLAPRFKTSSAVELE